MFLKSFESGEKVSNNGGGRIRRHDEVIGTDANMVGGHRADDLRRCFVARGAIHSSTERCKFELHMFNTL